MEQEKPVPELLFKRAGIKYTHKRAAILNGLIHAKRALSPYELAEFCKQTMSLTIPAVSIYRILDLFTEQNIVHKLDLVNKYIICAHLDCQHQHPQSQFLICNTCQKVIEVHLPCELTQQLVNQVKSYGFNLRSSQYELQGICNSCVNK